MSQTDPDEAAPLRERLAEAEAELRRQSRHVRFYLGLIIVLIAMMVSPPAWGLAALILLSAAILLAVVGFIRGTIGLLEVLSPSSGESDGVRDRQGSSGDV